jgi:TonB family protein
MADLQRHIKRCWYPPHQMETKRVKVIFTVTTTGEMRNLRLLQSSGLTIADKAALKAAEDAAPFRHLPEHAPVSVDIEFTFDYNVFSGGGMR